jgi:GNAT superfamily N-acetyltransferase
MDLQIQPFTPGDREAVIDLSLLAWAPVHQSVEQVLGSKVYTAITPDWREEQRGVVDGACDDPTTYSVYVARADGVIAGFIAYYIEHAEERIGRVHLLAVHPDFQNQGIGTALNTFALDKMRESGMRVAVVGTGGDPGHAPARRSYEKAGYTPLPLVRYYQVL